MKKEGIEKKQENSNKVIDKDFFTEEVVEETIDTNEVKADKTKVDKKEVKEVKEAKKKFKTKNCEVILIRKNKAFVEFNGQNIMVLNIDNKKRGDKIEVKYIGTIGKKDFKIV